MYGLRNQSDPFTAGSGPMYSRIIDVRRLSQYLSPFSTHFIPSPNLRLHRRSQKFVLEGAFVLREEESR